jgi:hypothetical protein
MGKVGVLMAWYGLVSYSYIPHGLTSAGGQMFSCFISVRTRENITVYLTQFLGSTHLAFKHPTQSRFRGFISASPRTLSSVHWESVFNRPRNL